MPLALVVAAVVVVVVGLLWWRGTPSDDPPRAEVPRVTMPRQVDDFRMDRTDQARSFVRETERQLAAQSPGSTVVAGTYAGPSGDVLAVGIVFPEDSAQAQALRADAGDAVRDYLDQVGLEDPRAADPGASGGALVCAPEPSGGPLNCVWGEERGVLVTLRFATGELASGPVSAAARASRRFLAAVVD